MLKVVRRSKTQKCSQATTDNTVEPATAGAGRHHTPQALQALGACSARKVLGTIMHLMPQLGTKFPLRCCSKRRWTCSALANQQIMQMRAFWPGPACPACPSIRPWHLLPVFSAKYIHLSSQGSQTSVRILNSTRERIYHPAMLSRLSRIWTSCAMLSRRTDVLLGSKQTSEARRSWPWVPLTVCRARKPETSK